MPVDGVSFGAAAPASTSNSSDMEGKDKTESAVGDGALAGWIVMILLCEACQSLGDLQVVRLDALGAL